jgi:hypothetical protein
LPSALGALLVLLALSLGLSVALGIILTALELGLGAVFASSNGSGDVTLALLTLLAVPLGDFLLYVAVIYFAVRLGWRRSARARTPSRQEPPSGAAGP